MAGPVALPAALPLTVSYLCPVLVVAGMQCGGLPLLGLLTLLWDGAQVLGVLGVQVRITCHLAPLLIVPLIQELELVMPEVDTNGTEQCLCYSVVLQQGRHYNILAFRSDIEGWLVIRLSTGRWWRATL